MPMAARGSLYAPTPEDRDAFLSRLGTQSSSDATLLFNDEKFDEYADSGWWAELDKAWDGIHRCLAEAPPESDEWPTLPVDAPAAAHAIGGGQRLTPQDDEWVVHFIPADLVKRVAAAIEPIDEDAMRARYAAYCKTAWGGSYDSPEDAEYVVGYFDSVKDIYRRAAEAGRDIIFMADL
jgi:hypothetical protein